MKKYEIFSTTADVGIKVWGREYADLYKNAIYGFNELIFGREFSNKNRLWPDSISHQFYYQGDSCENVLVNLLSEVIFQLYSNQKIVMDIIIKEAGVNYLSASLKTKKLTIEPEIEVKSVTYHNLKVLQREKMKVIEIVFDV